MYCPKCGPSIFRENYDPSTKTSSFTCRKCGTTYTSEELDEYFRTLPREKKYVSPKQWRDAEDGLI